MRHGLIERDECETGAFAGCGMPLGNLVARVPQYTSVKSIKVPAGPRIATSLVLQIIPPGYVMRPARANRNLLFNAARDEAQITASPGCDMARSRLAWRARQKQHKHCAIHVTRMPTFTVDLGARTDTVRADCPSKLTPLTVKRTCPARRFRLTPSNLRLQPFPPRVPERYSNDVASHG